MDTQAVVEKVTGLIQGHLEARGIELVDITCRREGRMVLRLLIDTPNGITLDECRQVNRFLSEALDKEYIIDGRYVIEVSSPGLDRHLKTDPDFRRVIGKKLSVYTFVPVEGKKEHCGVLDGISKEDIVLSVDGNTTVITRSAIAKAVLDIGF